LIDFYRVAALNTRDLLTHIRVRAFAAFGDETVDPRGDNRQRHRADLEHGIVGRADPRSSNARSRAASKNYGGHQ